MTGSSSVNPVFRFVVIAGSGLAFGCLLASVALVERAATSLQLRWHWAAPFLIAAGILVMRNFWNFVFSLQGEGTPETRRRMKVWAACLLIVSVMCFAYPMRFLRGERFREVVDGVLLAVAALSVAGTFTWKTIQAIERNEAKSLAEEAAARKNDER